MIMAFGFHSNTRVNWHSYQKQIRLDAEQVPEVSKRNRSVRAETKITVVVSGRLTTALPANEN